MEKRHQFYLPYALEFYISSFTAYQQRCASFLKLPTGQKIVL
jgi:hypothetical protein